MELFFFILKMKKALYKILDQMVYFVIIGMIIIAVIGFITAFH